MINIINQTFGYLTALECIGKDSHRRSLWLCRCKCGKEKTVRVDSLRSGHAKSCGCYSSQLTGERKPAITHGLSYSKIYSTWWNMHTRCYNPKFNEYEHYGGRGIIVCNQWHRDNPNGLDNFLRDMGHPPSLKHSIDRIDNDENYTPLNCRWATAKEQMQNRRKKD